MCCLGLLAALAAPAADFHVDRDRDASAAFSAARDAARKAPPGEPKRILFHGGKYFLTEPLVLGPEDSGVTVESLPGESAVLYGGQRITGWTRDGERFWSARLPRLRGQQWDFRMLVVNGRFCPNARLPATGSFTHLSDFKVRWMSTTGGGWERKPAREELTTMRYRPEDLGPWLDIRSAELRVYHMWDESLVRLAAMDETSHTLTFASPAGHPPGAFGVHNYALFNLREGMLAPGQWCLDRTAGKVVYWPLPGENMTAAEVVAPAMESILRLEGRRDAPVKGVTVRGLSFSVANTPPVAGGFGAGRFEGAVTANFTEGCTLRGLAVFNVNGQGIKAQNAAALRVLRCQVHDTGAAGIMVRGNEAEVADNRVCRVGLSYPSAIGLTGGGTHISIVHNEVYETPYSAVTCHGSGCRIEGNRLHHAMQEMHDGGAIYVGFGKGAVLRGNYVYAIADTGGYGSSAYYLDEQCDECLVEGNVSVGVARPSHNHMAHHNTIRGNVFLTDGEARLDFPRSADYTFERNVIYAAGDVVFRAAPETIVAMPNNVIFSRSGKVDLITLADYAVKGRAPLEPREGTVIADPLLIREGEGAYRFGAGSPALRLGLQPLDVRSAGPRE